MGTSSRYGSILEQICEFLWAAALIFLPLTSFPLLSSLLRSLGRPAFLITLLFLVPARDIAADIPSWRAAEGNHPPDRFFPGRGYLLCCRILFLHPRF